MFLFHNHHLLYLIFPGKSKEIYKCTEDETLHSLRKQIQQKEEISTKEQLLYFSGYWLNSDDDLLRDFLKNEDEIELHLRTATEYKKEFVNKVSNDVWIINGVKHHFSRHLLKPSKRVNIKLKSQRFGLCYHQEGDDYGRRVFQVERFEINHADKVEMRNSVGNNTAVYVAGQKIDPIHVSIYDERKNKGMIHEMVKIAFFIKEFKNNISSSVFGGKVYICV